jgi:hypothetical protein
MRPLTSKLDCHVTANLYRYRVQLEQTDRSDAYSTALGLRWRPGWGLAIHAEGQYLRNAVIENDGRFFLRIIKDFSMSSNNGGAK